MSFDSFGEFLAMGGHGLYVWVSYAASVIIVLANVISVRRLRRRYLREARALERRLGAASASPDGTEPSGLDPLQQRLGG
jgi:heme exporter protein D